MFNTTYLRRNLVMLKFIIQCTTITVIAVGFMMWFISEWFLAIDKAAM